MTTPPLDDDYAPSAEFYDYVPFYRHRVDVAFYVEEAVKVKGPVLEVACGSGRVLIPTARAGISIVGLDASAQMLANCRSSLQREPEQVQERVTLVYAHMRDFDLGRTFSLVTIPFRAFQHLLTVDDQLACLTCVRRHMSDDGRFIVDLFNPSLEMLVNTEVGVELDPDPPFLLPDGRTVQRRMRIIQRNRLTQVNGNEFVYYITDKDGAVQRIVHPFSMRNTFKFEMEHLLYRVGFVVEQVYADFDRSPFGSKYPGELIFVARKAT
jgi:SAM-dependent methyltransferase